MVLALLSIFFLQDFLQVLVMGIFLVPDIFLMCAILSALLKSGENNTQITIIWTAFVCGLFWDLRWTNLPGVTAAFNGAAVSAALFFWYKTPAQGRSTALFASFAVTTQALSGVVNYIFWDTSSQAALRQFMVQQVLSVPVLVILCVIFWKAYDFNA